MTGELESLPASFFKHRTASRLPIHIWYQRSGHIASTALRELLKTLGISYIDGELIGVPWNFDCPSFSMCTSSNRNKAPQTFRISEPIREMEPLAKVHMDLGGPLPKSKSGETYYVHFSLLLHSRVSLLWKGVLSNLHTLTNQQSTSLLPRSDGSFLVQLAVRGNRLNLPHLKFPSDQEGTSKDTEAR